MKGRQDLPDRHSVRLGGYDYSLPGAYYATVCTHLRRCTLGKVVGDRVELSVSGRIVEEEWLRSPQIRPDIVLDDFRVMPNHLHAIFFIVGAHGYAPAASAHGHAPASSGSRPHAPANASALHRAPRSVGSFVGGFKGQCTSRINSFRRTPGAAVWQRGFWEHIIRDDEDLSHAREYIRNNPARWAEDRNNPSYLHKTGYAHPPADYVPPGSPYDHADEREHRW